MNEHLFCNRALTGKWEPIDESELDAYELRLLAAIRKHNSMLMTRYLKQADRKQLIDDFVASYRVKYPRLALLRQNIADRSAVVARGEQ